MFTGIIEEQGSVKEIRRGETSSSLVIGANKVLEDTALGDSIAVNGVCLTVTRMEKDNFEADVMAETLRRSTLGSLRQGVVVNLERAMRADGRFGGHLVLGHIDGTGIIKKTEKEGNAIWVTIDAARELLRYIVEKGSIAIDGISLTVAAVNNTGFQVSIIPHTGKSTTLLTKKAGDAVNLECDIIGKYVEKLMSPKQANPKQSNIDLRFLEENGF